jgi:hypothetical protein
MAESTDTEATPKTGRYVTLHTTLVEHLLQRLGWSHEDLAQQMNHASDRNRKSARESPLQPPPIAVPAQQVKLLPKNVWLMLKERDVEKRTHALMVVAFQKGIEAWRDAHKLGEESFPMIQTLSFDFLIAAQSGTLIDTIQATLRLAARILTPKAQALGGVYKPEATTAFHSALVSAIRTSDTPQPFLASVTNASNVVTILESVMEVVAKKAFSPVTDVVLRTLAPPVRRSLVAMKVVRKDDEAKLKGNIRRIAEMRIGTRPPTEPRHHHWPRLPPFWAWMYGDTAVYGKAEVDEAGMLSTFTPSALLVREADPDAFDRIRRLIETGKES